MAKSYWLECDICKHEWVGQPHDESNTEKCPECNSEEFYIGKRYGSILDTSPFWVVLLIPNFLLWGMA